MRKFASRLAGLALFLVLAVPAAAQAAPPLWKIEQGESEVYLLGTIHLLKEDTPWYTPAIEEVVARADTLTVELDPTKIEPMTRQQTIRELGFYAPGETLSDNLPEELHTRLMAAAKKAELPGQAIDRMKPWLVGIQLATTIASKAGFQANSGVEMRLLEKAGAQEIEVRELESFREQMELFSGLSKEAQVAMLRDTLDEVDNIQGFFEELKTAWLEGDLETIDSKLTEGLEKQPELAETVLYERNRTWLPQIEALLEESGTHLVAVGAGHLIGEDSVIALLREKGYTAARQKEQGAASDPAR